VKKPLQFELFRDGARALAAAKSPKPPKNDEAQLQKRLDERANGSGRSSSSK
jgi:hypothetical protein